MTLPLSDVLSAIYDCEENSSLCLSSDWDGGWRVTIGGSQHAAAEAEAYVDSPVEAAAWLHEQAMRRYPLYKDRYGSGVIQEQRAHHAHRKM